MVLKRKREFAAVKDRKKRNAATEVYYLPSFSISSSYLYSILRSLLGIIKFTVFDLEVIRIKLLPSSFPFVD